MTYSEIIKEINDKLAGELLSYGELKRYLDEVIIDINNELDATFPMFSEMTGLEEVIHNNEDPFIRALDEHSVAILANTYYLSGNKQKFITAFVKAVLMQHFCDPEFKEIQKDTAAVMQKAEAVWSAVHVVVQEYDAFPDKYIRSVVIPGAAYKWYVMDEEGIPTADRYGYDYQDALFVMLRDYLEDVPMKYRAHTNAAVRHVSDVAFNPEWIRRQGL